MSCTRQNKGNAPVLTSLRLLLAQVTPPSRPPSETGALTLRVFVHVCVCVYLCMCMCVCVCGCG